jgi:hypothetical protein
MVLDIVLHIVHCGERPQHLRTQAALKAALKAQRSLKALKMRLQTPKLHADSASCSTLVETRDGERDVAEPAC